MEDTIIDEYQILSNLIVDTSYQEYFNELDDKFFTEPKCKRLFHRAKELFYKQQLNLENVVMLYKDDKDYQLIYKTLYTFIPLNEKSMQFSIDKLKELYSKNNLRNILTNSINSITPNTNVNDVISDLNFKLNKLDTVDEKIDLKANMALTDLFNEIDDIRAGKKSRIRTYVRKYDEMTGGLKGGEMTIVAGRPGTGKTTFALNMACNIAKKRKINGNDVKGKKVYFICLEMSTNQLMSKVLSYESGVNSQLIYSGKWDKDDFNKVNNAVNVINDDYELTFNTDLRYLEDMLTKIKKLKSKDLVDVVIVDYISLISTRVNNQTVRDKVSQISREFKLLSLELDIPIILLSQLNREAQSREPSIADLRESGSVEQDADNIILLYAEDEEKEKDAPIITCNLAKQRAGMVGKFNLKFMKAQNRFQGIEEGAK